MRIRRLRTGDEQVARRVVESFKGARPAAHHLAGFLANENNYLLVAEADARVVGFLLAYKMERCDGERPMMLLYEIEVLDSYRRQGIGKSLVKELQQVCRREWFVKMFVITAEANVAAMNLYRSTGGRRGERDEALFTYRIECM